MVTARLTAVMNVVFEPSWNRGVKNFLNPTSSDITKTSLYNFNPLKPNFYRVKLGFTGVYMCTLFSLFLLKNIDCWYSLEPPRRGGSNGYPRSMF